MDKGIVLGLGTRDDQKNHIVSTRGLFCKFFYVSCQPVPWAEQSDARLGDVSGLEHTTYPDGDPQPKAIHVEHR